MALAESAAGCPPIASTLTRYVNPLLVILTVLTLSCVVMALALMIVGRRRR